ncbi:acetyltransferase [Pseudomonas sp. S25]|uniref:Acetyltransferase n=1 Tax=Pseudomonas maioricensis TaxID=1766623 RepID=A0ABS9ZKK2_9PSED|nr:acetyltransferase [Pseudomonas sp. S25]MCI8210378.1 acetyltransferase [Pseudomonas sp. S25]
MILSRNHEAPLPVIIMGAGGHAKVLLSLLHSLRAEVAGVCDPALGADKGGVWRGIPILGGDEALQSVNPSEVLLVNGLGQLVHGTRRQKLYEALIARGFTLPSVIHPAAWVDHTAYLDDGVQVMAGAIIQADARIGSNSIINTGAVIDHDCIIGRHAHIAPSSVLCGSVSVGDGSFIAAGATVIQGIAIGELAVVGAGVTVVRDIPDGQVILGAPVRIKESRHNVQPKKS